MNKHHTRHKNDFDLYGDIARLKEVLAETTQDLKGKASDMIFNSFDEAKEKSAAVQDQMTTYISKKPLKAVGMAVLAGFIFGYWFHK